MADLKDRLKEAAEGGVVDAVKNGASSMLGWLWWLIPAAGIFTYFFRDAEWMPKGLMDTLREWMGKLALWLETTFPSLKPFLDKIFGDAAEKAAAAMSAESVRREITKDNKFSQAMANALMPDDAAKTELTRIFRENGGSIASGAAGFTPKVLAGMLTDPEGQRIIKRMLPVAAAERKNPPKDSAGNVIPGGADLIKNAIKGLLNDSVQFQTVASNPAAMGLLYQGAATISGVAFGEGALQQFVSAAKLTPEAQRQFFLSVMEDPTKAFTSLFNDKTVPNPAITGLALSIDASKVTDSALRTKIQEFQTLAADPQKLEGTRRVVQEVGREVAEAFGRDPIGTLVAQSNKDSPITGEKLAALAVAGGDAKNPLIKALQDKTTADQVITLVKTMEAQRTGSFTQLATLLTDPAIKTAAGQARFGVYIKESGQQETIFKFMEQLPASFIAPGEVAKLRQKIDTTTAPQLTAYANALDSFSGDKKAEAAFKEVAGKLQNNNLPAALPLLMDDALRARLITTNTQGESEVNATLANLIKVSIDPASGRIPETRTKQAVDFLTAGGNKNLTAMLTLIDTIDKNTGSEDPKQQAKERRADATNTKAMNFLLQLAIGNKPAADKETIQAISALFSKQENVEAFGNFLETIDVSTLSPQQQAFLNVLKTEWYKDTNRDGKFDPKQATLAGFGLGFSGDGGLAAYLANPELAARIFNSTKFWDVAKRAVTGLLVNPAGDISRDWAMYNELKPIREAAAKLEVTPAEAISPPTRTDTPLVMAASSAPATR